MTPDFVGTPPAKSGAALALKKSFIARSVVIQAVAITHRKAKTREELMEISENSDRTTPEGRAEFREKRQTLYERIEYHDAQLNVLAAILRKLDGCQLETDAERILKKCGGFEQFCATYGHDANGNDILDNYIETEYSML